MKFTSTLPIHYDSKSVMTDSHLPPTPSTSSSINAFMDNSKGKRPFVSQPSYGSMGGNLPYLDVSRPITPSQTTISPNDNDGGLYLLWAEQLLRERGHNPSSHHSDESDSSLSSSDEEEENDIYIDLLKRSPTMSTFALHSPSITSRLSTQEDRNIFSQLFSNCFAPCT